MLALRRFGAVSPQRVTLCNNLCRRTITLAQHRISGGESGATFFAPGASQAFSFFFGLFIVCKSVALGVGGGPLAVTRLREWGVGRLRFSSFDLL